MSTHAADKGRVVGRMVLRWLLMLGLWWVLSEGSVSYLGYGLLAATAATWASALLSPVRTPVVRRGAAGPVRRLRAVIGLVGWSLGQLVLGGVDVARRVVRRSVDVDPQTVTVDIRLEPGMTREFALGLMSLLPGTLVQGTEGNRARLHALSPTLDAAGQWRELERRVVEVTGTTGSEDGDGSRGRP